MSKRTSLDRYKAATSDSSTSNKVVATSSKDTTKRAAEQDEETAEYLRRKHKFIKSTIRTDYQPDICKDYKETGFCGFGDSCKFLHDRSDYKHGWQLEQEWAKGEYGDEDEEKYLIKDDEDDDDEIPNMCCICNETYKDPVMTRCKHYYCGDCAEKECNVKCLICEKPTSGIFKNASKTINELIKKRTKSSSENHDDKCDDDHSETQQDDKADKEHESDDDYYY